MIKSMTAYAKAEIREADISDIMIDAEIRSYNSKYLDIALKMDSQYNAIEDKIKNIISKRITRGRIELKLKIKDESQNSLSFVVDKAKAMAYKKALSELSELLAIKSDISLEIISRIPDIIKPEESKQDMDNIMKSVEKCLDNALISLDKMKKIEGDYIAKDINSRLKFIAESIKQIEKESEGLVSFYQSRLTSRIEKLTNDISDPARIAQETAILAEKSDISEEIVRVESHLEQFTTIMNEEESSGRKLNFLLQELNREFNTIGSKTNSFKVSSNVIEVKAELEKLREQIQNIE